MTVTLAAAASNAVMRGGLVTIGHAAGVNANSIDFQNIPGTFRDLLLVINPVASSTATGTGSWIRVNSDTGTNYSMSHMYGNGSTILSGRSSNQGSFWPTDAIFGNGIPGNQILHLFNYADTSRQKHGLIRQGGDANGSGTTYLYAVTWRSTAAVTQLTSYTSGGNGTFAHATATLYGIRGVGQ